MQGTRKTLTKELIWAIDADTPSEMLIYTVLRADTDAGHIERVTYPFRPIDTFTQAELVQGLIAYVHRGNGNNCTKHAVFSNKSLITRYIYLSSCFVFYAIIFDF